MVVWRSQYIITCELPPMKNKPLWQPNYTITPATASGLMEIEAARVVVAQVPLPVAVQAELRRLARVRSTHYSTD